MEKKNTRVKLEVFKNKSFLNQPENNKLNEIKGGGGGASRFSLLFLRLREL
jgi:hypothetical protein